MKKSKLIELLSAFKTGEIQDFAEFVASPYYNKNEDLIRFVQLLQTFHPDFPEEKIKKERVFKKMYPNTKFNKKQLAYLMNYLLKLGEQFLATQHYEQTSRLCSLHLLSEFSERKLEKHYQFLYKKTHKSLEEVQNTAKSRQSFFQQYQLADIALNHFISQGVRKFDPNLQYAADALDEFYFFHKLKYSCEMLNRQAILSHNYNLKFTKELQDYIQRLEEVDPLIAIYYKIFMSLSNPEEENHFQELQTLIDKNVESIDESLKKEVYLYAINYCAQKIRTGKNQYVAIMLDLYLEGIKNRSLFDGDYLSHWTYNNIVKLALRLKRYDFIEDFISDFTDKLAPQFRADAQHYNLAELYYHRHNYDQVLDNLNQLHFTDISYHLNSRIILIKTYYEIDAIEPLLSLLASFSIYLRRNKKISLSYQKTCLNFCNLLVQIMRRNPKKKEAIRESIRTSQPLAERAWLMRVWGEQLEKL